MIQSRVSSSSDREHNVKRPVLIVCGRTVVRPPPLKGQDECPNYLGTLAPKVKVVLVDFHVEMWKLDVSDAVMHNEWCQDCMRSHRSLHRERVCRPECFLPGRPVTMQLDPTLSLRENLLQTRRLRLGPGVRH